MTTLGWVRFLSHMILVAEGRLRHLAGRRHIAPPMKQVFMGSERREGLPGHQKVRKEDKHLRRFKQ